MKYFVIYIFSIFNFFIAYSLDAIYPVTLKIESTFRQGELLSNSNGDSVAITYFVKSDFAEANELISVSKGPDRTESKSITLQNQKIIDKMLIDEHLYLLTITDYKAQLVILNSNLDFDIYPLFDLRTGFSPTLNVEIMGKVANDVLIFFSGNLYKFNLDLNSLTRVEVETQFTNGFILSQNRHNVDFVGLVRDGSSVDAIYIKGDDLLTFKNKFVSFDENDIINNQDKLYFITSESLSNQSFIQSVSFESFSALNAFWLNAPSRLIDFESEFEQLKIGYVESKVNQYDFVIAFEDKNSKLSEVTRVPLPNHLLFPNSLLRSNDFFVVIFANGIVIIDYDGEIISVESFNLQFNENEELKLIDYGQKFIITSKTLSVLFSKQDNDFWFFNRILTGIKEYLIAVLFVLTLIILIQLYRHQRRLFREMIDLPGIGFMIFIDKNGRLVFYNALAKQLLGITKAIPKRKYFEFYFIDENYSDIAEIIKVSFETRTDITERINIEFGNDSREWICKTIVLRNIAGRFRGIFFTGVDITEQLQRKRLSNWAQIAHDMQTNLSTIKLNAEQIECDNFPEINKKKDRIIHQVSLLMHRVRDIVTVGRSDKVDYMKHDINTICNEVISEFDESVFPGITLVNDSPSILFYCDKAKIARAIRNAIENSIKATDNGIGKVQINAERQSSKIVITIKDNGRGMSPETLEKMMIPYFTTGRKTGGSGIGTMIIQHVVELHGGSLEIRSELGIGTEIDFILPILPSKVSKYNDRVD